MDRPRVGKRLRTGGRRSVRSRLIMSAVTLEIYIYGIQCISILARKCAVVDCLKRLCVSCCVCVCVSLCVSVCVCV